MLNTFIAPMVNVPNKMVMHPVPLCAR
jgi:hypothetical protein